MKIRFSSYPSNGPDYDDVMAAVYRIANIDQYPFKFRKSVDFVYANGRAIDFKMRLYDVDIAEPAVIAVVSRNDYLVMKQLVESFSSESNDIISIF